MLLFCPSLRLAPKLQRDPERAAERGHHPSGTSRREGPRGWRVILHHGGYLDMTIHLDVYYEQIIDHLHLTLCLKLLPPSAQVKNKVHPQPHPLCDVRDLNKSTLQIKYTFWLLHHLLDFLNFYRDSSHFKTHLPHTCLCLIHVAVTLQFPLVWGSIKYAMYFRFCGH